MYNPSQLFLLTHPLCIAKTMAGDECFKLSQEIGEGLTISLRNLGALSKCGLGIAVMPDCAFEMVLAACRIMGWDGAIERVVSACAGVKVEGARGAAVVAATGGMGAEMGGAETGGTDDEVIAGVEVVGGKTDAA